MPSFDDLILLDLQKERDLNPAMFSSKTLQRLSEYPLLLKLVLSADKAFPPLDLETCDRHIEENMNIIDLLRTSYARRSFEEIPKHPSVLFLKPTAKGMVTGSVPLKKRPSNESTGLQAAFEKTYQGHAHRAFIDALNFYNTTSDHKLYNKCMTIIQSSGMGKSRLVREVANEVFTIPANLREDVDIETYPPPDEDLRTYFEDNKMKSDDLLQVEYAVLLRHIFDAVVSAIPNITRGQEGSGLAETWTDHINHGQTNKSVGQNREDFYAKTLAAARKELAGISKQVAVDIDELRVLSSPSEVPLIEGSNIPKNPTRHLFYSRLNDPTLLGKKLGAMYSSAVKMIEAVGFDRGSKKTACIVYFDEAHKLTEPSPIIRDLRSRSPYHNLGTVLSRLFDQPIFFIFLSTNSHIKQLAPPPIHHPSFRAARGDYLVPPFTALPFDVFMAEVFKSEQTTKKPPSLVDVCTTRAMSSMGRPMWFVHHEQWEREKGSSKQPDHVLEFAMQKLTARNIKKYAPQSELAALSVRVGVTFESMTSASREAEAKQVESHMRVVYAIPEHREYMRTGSPSEPVLAEAAARYLNQVDGDEISTTAPRILSENCAKGFLARGERGELCGRLLMTIAHDIAVAKTSPQIQPLLHDPEVLFHRPVPVLAFLRALFADTHHDTILNATPATDKQGEALGVAFKDAYVCFSHFALAADSAMLDASALRTALFRGMAIQAKDNQVSIDAVIPIHMGSITNPITTKTTSAINLQFKNRKVSDPCSVNRSITVPDPEQPVISIVLELGEELPRLEKEVLTSLLEVQHWDRRVTRGKKAGSPPHQDDRHYLLVARGCGPETYNAIPKKGGDVYAGILASGGLKDDSPLRANKNAWALVEELKPSFIAAKCLEQWDEYFLESASSSVSPGAGSERKQATLSARGRSRKVNEARKSNDGQKAGPSESKRSNKKRKSGEE